MPRLIPHLGWSQKGIESLSFINFSCSTHLGIFSMKKLWRSLKSSDGNSISTHLEFRYVWVKKLWRWLMHSKLLTEKAIISASRIPSLAKNERNYFLISALAPKNGSNQKSEGTLLVFNRIETFIFWFHLHILDP